MARPSKQTDAIITEIADRLSKGEPLAVICRDEHMPSDTTVRNWMNADEAVSSAIARGRELGWDMIAHNARTVARGKGESTQDIQRDKLIIETDLKLLAKWDPKRYGDKVTQEHTGADGGPIQHQNLDDAALEARVAALMAQVKP